jgi:ATP-dependent 26S proteasome regulatory subunit
MDVPDQQTRLQILHYLTRQTPLSPSVNLENLASVTNGYVGADLAALVREATICACIGSGGLDNRYLDIQYYKWIGGVVIMR